MKFRLLVAAVAAAATLGLCACSTRYADDSFVQSADTLRPSVVLLSMDVPGAQKGNPDSEFATGIVIASGSWGSDILTVEHAIEQASNLKVTIANKSKVAGDIIAKNATLDVALVRIKREPLPVAKLGSSKDAQPGRLVGLLGYPIPDQFDDEGLGLATSLNSGRVSSMRQDAIEVNLPIVPGESGSPVFLSDTGEIVGIAESRFDEERSIGFALPAEEASKFLHAVDARHGL